MLSTCSSNLAPAERRHAMRPFSILFTIYALFYVVTLFASPVKNSPLAWTLALGNGIFMVAMLIAAAVGFMRQRDEFQRKLLTQAAVWGIGGMFAITIVWGLLEVHTSVPRMDVLVNFPLFLVIAAIAKVTLFRGIPISEQQ